MIGIFYHFELVSHNNKYYADAVAKGWIESLDKLGVRIYFFCFTKISHPVELRRLNISSIEIVDLGKKKPIWARTYFSTGFGSMESHLPSISDLIIRCPTPGIFWIYRLCLKYKVRVTPYFVGDYRILAKERKIERFSDYLILLTLRVESSLHLYVAHRSFKVLVNNRAHQKYFTLKRVPSQYIHSSTVSSREIVQFKPKTKLSGSYLFVGRLENEKGIHELLDAFSLMQGDNRLHIIGALVDNTSHIASRISKAQNVIYHGKIQDRGELMSLFKLCEVLIVPSWSEGFPRVIWEAFASNLLVIATKVGGIPSVITHGENGLLCEPKSVTSLLQSMEYAKNVSAYNTMVRNSSLIIKDYTQENSVKSLLQIIRSEGNS